MTEQEYAKRNHGYVPMNQRNSDGSDGYNPHDEALDIINLSIDFLLFVLLAGAITFFAFFVVGFFGA